MGNLFQKRTVYLTGAIDDELADEIVKQLFYLDSQSDEEIVMYINSGGGSVPAGFSIIDAMNYIDSDVRAISSGTCASMASFILSSATKGKRMSFKNCQHMIHQPSIMGDYEKKKVSDIAIECKNAQKIKNKMIKIMAKNVNRPYWEVEKAMDRDHFLSATEAYRFGLIDFIIE